MIVCANHEHKDCMMWALLYCPECDLYFCDACFPLTHDATDWTNIELWWE